MISGRVARDIGKAASTPSRHDRYILHAIDPIGHGSSQDRGAGVDRFQKLARFCVEHAKRTIDAALKHEAHWRSETPPRSCQPRIGTWPSRMTGQRIDGP